MIHWIILLYKHNGICRHTHYANVLLPLEYVNESIGFTLLTGVRTKHIGPQTSVSPQF